MTKLNALQNYVHKQTMKAFTLQVNMHKTHQMQKRMTEIDYIIIDKNDGSKDITIQWDDTTNPTPYWCTIAVYLAYDALTEERFKQDLQNQLDDFQQKINQTLRAITQRQQLTEHGILLNKNNVDSYNEQLGNTVGQIQRLQPIVQNLQTTTTSIGLTLNTEVQKFKDLTDKQQRYQTRTDTTLHQAVQNIHSLSDKHDEMKTKFDELSDKLEDIPDHQPDFFTRLTQALSTLSSTVSLAKTANDLATENTSKLKDIVSTVRDATTIAHNAMGLVRDITPTVNQVQETLKDIKENWTPKIQADIKLMKDKIIEIDGPEMTLLYKGQPLEEEYYDVTEKDVQ